MRKKKISSTIALALFMMVVLLLLIFCSGRYGWKRLGFAACEVKLEDDWFSIGCPQFNGIESHTFDLKSGDEIGVNLIWMGGRFDITIGQRNKEPIYTGNDASSGSFTVTVPEDGLYEISVSGKKAEGSLSFEINKAKEVK